MHRLVSLSLALSVAAAAPVALAAPENPFDLSPLPTVAGKIQRILPSAQGDAAALLLADHTQIVLSPSVAHSAGHNLKSGDLVQAQGLKTRDGRALRAFVLTGPHGAVGHDITAEARPDAPPPEPGMMAHGRIVLDLVGDDGLPCGVLLDDGTAVYVPRGAWQAWSARLQPGRIVAASGNGASGPFGRAIEASGLGAGDQPMAALDAADTPPPGAAAGSAAYDSLPEPGVAR